MSDSEGISHILTNEAIPRTEATITVRVIKSFEYRTERSLVLHKLNLETTTVGGLKEIVRQSMLRLFIGSSLHRSQLQYFQLSRLDPPGDPTVMLFWVRIHPACYFFFV